jgi:hypothetical protein
VRLGHDVDRGRRDGGVDGVAAALQDVHPDKRGRGLGRGDGTSTQGACG